MDKNLSSVFGMTLKGTKGFNWLIRILKNDYESKSSMVCIAVGVIQEKILCRRTRFKRCSVSFPCYKEALSNSVF